MKYEKLNIEGSRLIIILLTLMCIFPPFVAMYTWLSQGVAVYIVFSIFFLSFSLFILPFLLFKNKTAFLINTLCVLLSPLELVSLIMYKNSIKGGLVFFIFQSDVRELSELFLSYKFFAVLYVIELIVYVTLTIKFVENKSFIPSKKIRLKLLGGFVLFFLILYAYSLKVVYNSKERFGRNIQSANIAYNFKFRKIYPYNAVYALYSGFSTYYGLRTVNDATAHFKFGAKQEKETPNREIYVFVIGETARYANFGINGYKRETTPLLSKTSNLISFSDVYSEANSTEMSLPILLTRSTANNFNLYQSQKSVVDAFKEAGFNTYWIANQSSGNYLIQRIVRNATSSYFAPIDFDDADNFDEKLWKNLDEVLNKNEKKQFIVLHTLGSHFRYNQRYPKKYEKYVPALKGMTDNLILGEKIKTELLNSYDNSIFYTDYFLSQTIKKLVDKDAKSYLFYISDHAEGLFDDGIIFHGSRVPSISEIHVPMIIWTSEKYNKENTEEVEALRLNRNKKIGSNIVFHTLLDMANIRFNDFGNYYATNPFLKSDTVRYCINSDSEIYTFK